ncbi:MAG: response regulator [Candidatus Thermoplasmatota archaeon]
MSDKAAGPSKRAQVVLLVDDELDIRDSLKLLLEAGIENIEVATAESGAIALDTLSHRTIDLIITDYKMPGMNGLEFLGHAQKIAPKVPRILVTAFPDLEIAIKAINEAGIENFFTKPFEPDQVLGVVRELLKEQRAQALRNQSFARSIDMLRRGSETKK